jgi:hypothetical protein
MWAGVGAGLADLSHRDETRRISSFPRSPLSSPFIERRAGQGVRASVDNEIVIAAGRSGFGAVAEYPTT